MSMCARQRTSWELEKESLCWNHQVLIFIVLLLFHLLIHACTLMSDSDCFINHQSELVGDVAVPASVRQAVLF